jgi:hypothetical protein
MEKVQYTQSEQERFSILLDFFNNEFPVKFPHLEPPFSQDGHTTLCPPSAIILYQVVNAEPTIKKGLLFTLVAELDLNKLLVPKQVVQVVERQPTADEIKKAKKDKFEREAAAGFHREAKNQRTELDRDDQYKKPPMLEEQKQALNTKTEKDNAIIADVQSRINTFTGATHSKTYSGRDALKQTFVDAMNKGLSAEQVQKAVEAKLDSFAGNNSVR